MKNILLHSICLVRRPAKRAFFIAGIQREIKMIQGKITFFAEFEIILLTIRLNCII